MVLMWMVAYTCIHLWTACFHVLKLYVNGNSNLCQQPNVGNQ